MKASNRIPNAICEMIARAGLATKAAYPDRPPSKVPTTFSQADRASWPMTGACEAARHSCTRGKLLGNLSEELREVVEALRLGRQEQSGDLRM
jgi:hypothetical protein